MMICPQCAGYGQALDSNENCQHCRGWGVLMTMKETCPVCKGKKVQFPMRCMRCGNEGTIEKVFPLEGLVKGDGQEFITAPAVVTVEGTDLRDALTLMRVGYDGNEPEHPQALGVLATLVDVSSDLDDHPIRDWLQGDRIVIEPSGIWVVRGDAACRIHEFEVSYV